MEKVLFDYGMIARTVKRISYEIVESNKGTDNLVLVGIKTRGEFLAKRIVEFIEKIEGVKVELVAIDTYNYRDDNKNSDDSFNNKIDVDLTEKNIVIVDDVLFTGRTIRAAMSAIMDLGRPNMIKLAVLIDRGHRELPIRPDYIGKNIPTSKEEKVKVLLTEVDNVEQDEILLEG